MSYSTPFKFDKVSIEVFSLEGYETQVSLEWTEPSSYCMFDDVEYSADVTRGDAIGIINALKSAFDIKDDEHESNN